MQRVLIPTDFSVESLQLIEYAVLNYPRTELEIILVCGYKLPDSMWGLRNFSSGSMVGSLSTEAFKKAVGRINKQYCDQVKVVRIELFIGSNAFSFQNFIEQFEVQDGIVRQVDDLAFENAKCFDPSELMRKCMKHIVVAPVGANVPVRKAKLSFAGNVNI